MDHAYEIAHLDIELSLKNGSSEVVLINYFNYRYHIKEFGNVPSLVKHQMPFFNTVN